MNPGQIQSGKSIAYTAMKQGLQELNRSITFDDGCGQVIYMSVEGRMRAGIYFNNKYLSAVERATMSEFTIFDGSDRFEVPCSRDEFLTSDKNDLNYFTQELFVYKDTRPMDHFILDQWIGLSGSKTLKNGKGGETLLIRVPTDMVAHDGATVPAGSIIVSTPMKIVTLPCQVLHIGWREVFERLLQANIPRITKESLSKKFGVDMTAPFTSDLQLVTATKGIPTISH